MEKINVVIVEDDRVIRESLVKYLGVHPSIEVKLVVGSMEAFLEKTEGPDRPDIDIVLLDIGLPGMSGIKGILHIRKRYPDTDVVILTAFEEDEKIFEALRAGACSYLTKRSSLSTIRETLFTVYRGGAYMSPSIARKVAAFFTPSEKKSDLTPRQMEIVEGIVDGLSYKMVGEKLGIKLDTVRDHIKRIYKTLEIQSKAELIRKYLDGDL